MEKKISGFTVLTFLLFAVSTPNLFLNPVVGLPDDESKSSPASSKSSPASVAVSDSNLLFSNQKRELNLDETLDVSAIDPMPRLKVSRLHPKIKRYLTTLIPVLRFGRNLCGKFEKQLLIPRAKIPYGNNVILSRKSDGIDPETSGDLVPNSLLEFKRNHDLRPWQPRQSSP